jgi:hypothetical protein
MINLLTFQQNEVTCPMDIPKITQEVAAFMTFGQTFNDALFDFIDRKQAKIQRVKRKLENSDSLTFKLTVKEELAGAREELRQLRLNFFEIEDFYAKI